MKTEKKWILAQKEELACWESNTQKLNTQSYEKIKKEYWQRILKKASVGIDELSFTKVLEVGCGPTGIFMCLDPSKKDGRYILLDPLVEDYKKITPRYFGNEMLISKPIEDVDGLENEQYIFAINCIDHAHDIDKFLQKIHSFSNENTKIFIAVNTHNYSGLAHFWKIFQKLLEPLHPYHFTENEYTTLFSNSFNIEKIEDIEEDIIWINNLTRTQKDASLIGSIKGAISKLHPRTLFFKSFEIFGYPVHDFKGVGNSIYAHKLYILTKK